MVIEKVPTVPPCRRQARHRLDADPAPGFGTEGAAVRGFGSSESRACIVIEKVPTAPLRRRQARHRQDADPAPGLGTTAGTVQ